MLVQRNDAWRVSEDDFPRSSPVEAQLGFLLRYAILAPSVRNTQPWAFSVRGNRVHLFADFRKAQPVADPDRRELYISLGCALENLLVAAEHFGFGHGIAYFPERGAPDLVATFGDFKKMPINAEAYGQLNAEAVDLLAEVGYE